VKPLRVPTDGLFEGVCVLDADASNYVLRVHRVSVGAPLQLFDPGLGVEATATLVGCRGRAALCEVSSIVAALAVPRERLVLLQAHAKGDKVDRVVRDATALGVTELVIVATERSIVQLDVDESSRRTERFRRIAVESARQCGRGNIPLLKGPVRFENLLREPLALPDERWVLSPQGQHSLGERMAERARGPVALFIGPEGGFAEREVGMLSDLGFLPVRFSEFVLRTETAATAVLGAVAAWSSRT
jgi:16S rRNA (uracil1498-N3)-methyltransferase